MNKDKLVYKGKVKLDVMKKGRRLNTSIHNTGLPDMSWMFAKAVSGNLNSSTDVPRLLDLGYEIPDTAGIWTSILNNPVNIGGRQYSFDNSLDNWIGTLIGTIYYTDLNGIILDNVIDMALSGTIQLKLRLCSYNDLNRKYFAEVNVTPEEVTQIKELTSVIVTWYSELIPEVEYDEALDGGTIEKDESTQSNESTQSEEPVQPTR